MEIVKKIRTLADKVASLDSNGVIQTEEATKNSMIMPLIMALGYDVFNPHEVMPEFIADIGIKKGEKVDYAILLNNNPVIIFECKKSNSELSRGHASQLVRYYQSKTQTKKIGVLTNGLVYKFYADLDQENLMDDMPFFEFNLLNFTDADVEELAKFSKSMFDIDAIFRTASELKYKRDIHVGFFGLMEDPEPLVKILASKIKIKRVDEKVVEKLKPMIKEAWETFINRELARRFQLSITTALPTAAITTSAVSNAGLVDNSFEKPKSQNVITTSDELEGYHVVKSILRKYVEPSRIYMRDAASYCSVILDDSNRKIICRLRFNDLAKKKIGIFTQGKEEKIFDINNIDQIFEFEENLRAAVNLYLNTNVED